MPDATKVAEITATIERLVTEGHSVERAAALAFNMASGGDRAAGILYRVGDCVLLLMRAPTATDHPSTWGFPGGSIDEGETPEQAAIRESTEEIAHTPAEALRMIDWFDGFTTFAVDMPEVFAPILNPEHTGYLWASLSNLPQPLHPGCARTLANLPVIAEAMDAAREYDGNGWFEVKGNPISKAGVFPYSGRALGKTGVDADRIFQVLRPPEELSDPECIESFKLIPWIDNHVMLGPRQQEMTPNAVAAETKGVQGVIGEDVFFEGDTLFANIKAFSSTLAALIQAGKRELSAGYRCIYDMTSGVWNGKPYDAVQRKIRGNHLALVTEGRMGPSVAVLDRMSFSFDAKEIEMADPTKKAEDAEGGKTGDMTLSQLVSVVSELAPQVAKMQEAIAAISGGAKPAAEVEVDKAVDTDPAKPADEAAAEGSEGTPAGSGMDAAEIERKVLRSINERNSLVKSLTEHVGAFDHAEKTHAELVAYGCEKLGVKAPKGSEAAALAGFLQARPAATPPATVAAGMDAAPAKAGNFVDRHLTNKGA